MKIKIEYADGGTQEVDGTYKVHENYIELRYADEDGSFILIVPMDTILYLEATLDKES